MKSFREYLREAEAKSKCVEEEATTEYKEYFKKMLDKYKVGDPSELSKEDKQKFFDEVDAGWKGKDEEPEDSDVSESKIPNTDEDAIKILQDIINRDKVVEAYKTDIKLVINYIKNK